jgi:tRNA modification GTPase
MRSSLSAALNLRVVATRHLSRATPPRATSSARLYNSGLTLSQAQKETIYALATPQGKGGVAVIRVSGQLSREVYARMVKPWKRLRGITDNAGSASEDDKMTRLDATPKERMAIRCRIVDEGSGEMLDDGIALWFACMQAIFLEFKFVLMFFCFATAPAPRSFTSEDVLELHIHSGRAVITAILSSLSRIRGCRPAERGEFTRRAYENGKFDLTQVEGITDIVDADTEEQRKLAIRAVTVCVLIL